MQVQHTDIHENLPLEALRQLQFERLKQTLHHAYENSAVYRRKFDAAGYTR
jgi:phenylacetate-CoA ligase